MGNDWIKSLSGEARDYSKEFSLTQNNAENQLKCAFSSIESTSMALVVLKQAPLCYIELLAPEILYRAIATHGPVELARTVLARLPHDRLKPIMEKKVLKVINDPVQDWEQYRRTAEVLKENNLNDLLTTLASAAAQSSDIDIREVGEDYP
jgi:hypothetical protein